MIRTKPTARVNTAALNVAHGHTKPKEHFMPTARKFLSTAEFSYSGERQEFSAEASRLGFPPGYFPTCITLQSERTGVMMSFLQESIRKDSDGEFSLVRYKSKTCEMFIVIFND